MTGVGLHIDDSELHTLEVDLRGAPGRAQRGVTEVIRSGSKRINHEMQVDAAGHHGNWFGNRATSYLLHLERYVSDEMLSPFEAEIGIEYRGQGKLAHIIVKGSIHNAPAYDYMAGPYRAIPSVEDKMGDMGEDAVFGVRSAGRTRSTS